MGARHEERPGAEPEHAHLHAEAHTVARAVQHVIARPADQHGPGADPQLRALIHHDAEQHHGERDHEDRERMADRDRQQRLEDHGPALPVQPERDREQPAHRRIYAVEGAEPGKRQPWQNSLTGVPRRSGRRASATLCSGHAGAQPWSSDGASLSSNRSRLLNGSVTSARAWAPGHALDARSTHERVALGHDLAVQVDEAGGAHVHGGAGTGLAVMLAEVQDEVAAGDLHVDRRVVRETMLHSIWKPRKST